MTPDALFSVATVGAGVGWLLLLFVPGHRRTAQLSGIIIPLTLCALYVVVLAISARHVEGGFRSLESVGRLFGNHWSLLAGWIHYLAFDLLIGSWIAADALLRGVGRPSIAGILLLTFLFGPLGLLAYLLSRGLLSPSARSERGQPGRVE